jgi:glycine cleavage system H lipoate-binding protein
VNTHLSHDP